MNDKHINNRINYSKELDRLLLNLSQKDETIDIMLHACCAPCSSYCIEYLSEYADITVFFYNPNISCDAEYMKRAAELKRLIRESDYKNKVSYTEADYEPDEFFDAVKGYESCPEGGERCFICYEQRLRRTAKEAKKRGFTYFCSTLTISPLKSAAKINEIGIKVAKEENVMWLPSDFKKKNGYKRSIELSKEHSLYRQNYCGCIYSMRDI